MYNGQSAYPQRERENPKLILKKDIQDLPMFMLYQFNASDELKNNNFFERGWTPYSS